MYLCRQIIINNNMKRILLIAIVALLSEVKMQAQNIPAEMRMEVTSVEQDKNEFEVFTYKDKDGTFGYYLSLGRVVKLRNIFVDPEFTTVSFDHIDETCLYLGSTYDEAYKMLGDLLDLCKEELGTEKEFSMRASKGNGELLGDRYITVCQVGKKPIVGGKRLEFFFAKGVFTCHLRLNKTAIKQLRWGMKLDKKLHPKQHKFE